MRNFLIVILFISPVILLGQTNKEIARGCYSVCRIDSIQEFYLIFIEKNYERYTIYSKKDEAVKGEKIKVGNSYFFELYQDTFLNGESIIPMNYMDITYFGKYSGREIGRLCTTNNLRGLIIVDKNEK